jgi:hypothetical protein
MLQRTSTGNDIHACLYVKLCDAGFPGLCLMRELPRDTNCALKTKTYR